MTWAADGMTVFLSTHQGWVRCKVLVSAGNDCRIERDDDKKTFWVSTSTLFSEEQVAADAARRLGAS